MAFGGGHRRGIVRESVALAHDGGEVSPRHDECQQRQRGCLFDGARPMHPLLGGGLSTARTILTQGG
jgi:hypothetical protein